MVYYHGNTIVVCSYIKMHWVWSKDGLTLDKNMYKYNLPIMMLYITHSVAYLLLFGIEQV